MCQVARLPNKRIGQTAPALYDSPEPHRPQLIRNKVGRRKVTPA